MDAIELLTSQHRETQDLFEQFGSAGDDDRKQEIAQEIIQDLMLHTTLEEEFFYPAIREKAPQLESQILEDYEEHHAVELLLQELQKLDPSHERFEAKVAVVRDNVEEHIEEEENELFPQVRDAFEEQALADLGEQMQQAAKQQKLQRLTKAELYERAQGLEVAGRSQMSKEQLVEAVQEEE